MTSAVGAAASTSAEASHAAMQALHASARGLAGTAVDGLVAGVLALAASRANVLLGAATILLGGTGEGLAVLDGRARQPGLEARRPRGFVEGSAIPDAARVAAPGLPAALALAHAGRGERTLLELAQLALAGAKNTEKSRAESILAFGRSGATFLRVGAIRDALLGACARSVGGVLTGVDLDDARPQLVEPLSVDLGARTWIVAPWTSLDDAPAIASQDVEDDAPAIPSQDVEIVAVVDARGAFALAAVVVASSSLPLSGHDLEAPLLAEPVRRGVARVAPATPLAMCAPIGLSRRRDRSSGEYGGIDLGLGVGGAGDSMRALGLVARAAGIEHSIDDALSQSSAVRGVSFDGRHARALKTP